jgi:hypothetical protein
MLFIVLRVIAKITLILLDMATRAARLGIRETVREKTFLIGIEPKPARFEVQFLGEEPRTKNCAHADAVFCLFRTFFCGRFGFFAFRGGLGLWGGSLFLFFLALARHLS